ncbi:MAG: tetratricopeptide repeat protein [Candidatus Krumholzibacteriota bacterium]|nr:tetratricopeptide repeat protein [Candidatus Krumholzibacteriota bacterium]
MRRRLLGAGLAALLLAAACAPKGPPEGNPFALPGEATATGEPGLRHVVAAGETWASLAEDYYGDPRRGGSLRRANGDPAEALSPGDEVFVPMSRRQRAAFERRAEARAPYNRGLELARRGDYPDAILAFEEALRIDPELAAALYNLGLVYQRTERLPLAVQFLDRAARMQPYRAGYHYALGAALAGLDRPRMAERAFHRALDQDPRHLPSLYALASSLEARGRHDEARRHWLRYLELDPDSVWGREARERLADADP